jgi:hypothetical protein
LIYGMDVYRSTFGPSEAGRVLKVPGATLRSWDKRGLVPTDPALAGRHRHLWTLDVFYVGLLREFLAGGLSAEAAAQHAAAVIYGDSDTELRYEVRRPSPERVRACQRDYQQAWPDVRHRGETAPYWVIYSVHAVVSPAVLPWPDVTRHVQELRHFGAINLTRLLAEIERSLAELSSTRTPPR